MDMDTGMDAIIHLTEVRGVRGAALRDHLYIRRCLCGLRGYLRDRLRRWALEGVDTNETGRKIGIGIGRRIESESEGDMEDRLREAAVEMEMEAAVGGLVGVCRIHSVAVRTFFFLLQITSYVDMLFCDKVQTFGFHGLESIFRISNAPRRCCHA